MTENKQNASVIEEVSSSVEQNVSEPVSSKGTDTSYTVSDVMDILKDIDTMNASFEANRAMFEAKDKLLKACAAVGIGRLDHELIHKRLKESDMTDDELDKIMKDKKKLDEMFFTKENGKPMKLKEVQGYSDFEVKREMIAYIHSYYVAEKEMNEQIDAVHKDVADTTGAGTEVLIDHIAASFLAGMEQAKADLKEEPENEEKQIRIKKIDSIYKAFTFDDIIEVLDTIPKVVTNTLWDYGHETRVRSVGEKYGKMRQEANIGSALYSIIADNPEDSIESKFLRPNQYVKGYENLFVFLLVRYYGAAKWKEKESFIKERHNMVCTLLRALVEGKMPKETRDKYVENIAKVWEPFYAELSK